MGLPLQIAIQMEEWKTDLELLDKRVVDLAVHGGENSLLGESAVQDLLDGNGARHTDYISLVKIQTFVSR